MIVSSLLKPTAKTDASADLISFLHYDNTPMQYTAIFHGCKNGNFQMNNCDIFLFLLKT